MGDEKETELRKVGSPPAALTPSASPSNVTKTFIARLYIILRSPATSAKQRCRFLREGSYPMQRRYRISSGVLPTLSTRYRAAPSRPSRLRQILSATSASLRSWRVRSCWRDIPWRTVRWRMVAKELSLYHSQSDALSVQLVISSVQTLKLTRVLGPNVVAMATSMASRPLAISTRPIRGMLLRASKVYQRPPR
jgi:hypothetical protein